VHAVTDLSFTVASNEVLGIVGESGSGKSVTSLAIMGLLPRRTQLSGSIEFDGVDLLAIDRRRHARYRGSAIGMVFQDPMTSLNPVHRISWQLVEAIRLHHRNLSRKAARRRAIELLQLVGIPQPDERIDHYPHEFSGGMRQRVMIAIAIANRPRLLICDEPTTALDVTIQAQVLDVIGSLRDDSDMAIMLITHDLGVVAGMADRAMVMYAGRAVETGTVDDIFYQPRMPYTIGLLRSIPSLATAGTRLHHIAGTSPTLLDSHTGCAFAPRCEYATIDCSESTPQLASTDTQDHRAACLRWQHVAGDTRQ
jgi:peptide/nickel transport system ATP-binding protein